jgi:hypothetical protein
MKQTKWSHKTFAGAPRSGSKCARMSTSKSAIPREIVWSSDIRQAFNISTRTFRNWRSAQIVPDPDGNVLGRDFWLPATFEKFKEDIVASRHSKPRVLPPLKSEMSGR